MNISKTDLALRIIVGICAAAQVTTIVFCLIYLVGER